ncbi:rRNA maturation RNase YbeY [Chloroflexota bacterium]
MINLEIAEDFGNQLNTPLIEKTAQNTLLHESAPQDSEITIVITNDEQLQALNHQFRDINAPTDVLSFPADFIDPENDAPYIGDILISHPRAVSQAAIGGHSVMAEIQLLVVHGILHLLGYDHTEPSEKTVMWVAQKEILDLMGLENLKISEGK